MGTMMYSCGCSVTRSMFGERKITNFNLCSWHNYIYNEDKTIKQIVEIRQNVLYVKDACYCLCHYYFRADPFSVQYQNDRCPTCNHNIKEGTYNINNDGWTPNKLIRTTSGF